MKKIVLCLLVFLVSCSETPEPEVKNQQQAKKTAAKKAHPKMSKDNVFKGYGDAVDKAKAAEKDVLDAAEKQRQAIEDAMK